MPSQAYRGHVIEVSCYVEAGRISYRSWICAEATGQLRHSGGSSGESFATESGAQDHAFRAARGWIDGAGLPWPFNGAVRGQD